MKDQENVPVKILRKHDGNSTFLRFLNNLNFGFNLGFTNEGKKFFQKDNERPRYDAEILQAIVPITPAQIISMFTTAVDLIPAPGPGKALLFVDGVLVYKRQVATYTGGGNVQIRVGTTVITAVASAGNSFGAAADRIVTLAKLNTANGILLTENVSININNLTGVFVNPGTATGYGMAHILYKIIDLNLPQTYRL